MKTPLLLLAILTLVASAATAATKPVNTSLFGTAIKGYDAVAYFTDNKPVKGNSKFSLEWNGAEWHFASAEHRDAFKAEPEKYAPQFGGYCAWAVSQGYTAGVDPEAWRIIGGKLYLNYSKDVQANWEKDAAGNIARGEVNWPKILAK